MKAITALALAMAALPAVAAEFTVTPLRADLTPAAKSASFAVSNMGRESFGMQVVVRRWRQDANGADVFEDTADLVSYPKRFDVAPGARRIIRVGTNKPGGETEGAYRVFLEELPPVTLPGEQPDSKVAVLVNFAVPVFVRPARPAPMAQLEVDAVSGGKATLRLTNTGNQTFFVEGLAFTPPGITAPDFAGWYVQPGQVRTYVAVLDSAACAAGKFTVSARLLGAKPALREAGVTAAQCKE